MPSKNVKSRSLEKFLTFVVELAHLLALPGASFVSSVRSEAEFLQVVAPGLHSRPGKDHLGLPLLHHVPGFFSLLGKQGRVVDQFCCPFVFRSLPVALGTNVSFYSSEDSLSYPDSPRFDFSPVAPDRREAIHLLKKMSKLNSKTGILPWESLEFSLLLSSATEPCVWCRVGPGLAFLFERCGCSVEWARVAFFRISWKRKS